MVCDTFDIARSSYYAYRHRKTQIDSLRIEQRAKVNELFSQSRSSAGSRTIMIQMQEEGHNVGRYRVRSLMRELNLTCKQPGPHKYKQVTVERPDIPNRLNRDFTVERPNQVWCGDITYVWAQNRWHYLAVVLKPVCTARGGLGIL